MRRLGALLDLKSPNYLNMILEGKRALSTELGLRIAEQMGLKEKERDYFISLIEVDGSSSDHTFDVNQRKVLSGRRYLKTEPVDEDRAELVSSWYHLLVRELMFLPDFEFSPDYIVRKLNGRVSVQEAQQSLELLKTEIATPSDKVLDTGNQTFSRAVMIKYHTEMLKVWSEGLEFLNPAEQELGLLNIPIASEKLPELQRRIRQFQDELIGWLVDEKCPDRVVQVGTYLIPFDK